MSTAEADIAYEPPLRPAVLLRRYKRFLADVRDADGREFTVHTPNTGSMLGCAEPGMRVWLQAAANPRRKHRWSWVASELPSGVLVGVDTHLANRLAAAAITAGRIPELAGYARVRREVAYGDEGSRVDLLLEDAGGRPACHVEVKNVTAVVDGATAVFPDAVSRRGTRHLRELMRVAAAGGRAAMFYCVQREDARCLAPARAIDPEYAAAMAAAAAAGVELLAWRARVTPRGVTLQRPIPVVLD